MGLFRRQQHREFWALRGVSFDVNKGETLGIIGSNGAGKSTLLSLLAGTKFPTEGKVSVQGTVASLLELGAGFHPELTGRENVMLYGAVMGLRRRQIEQRFDAIVEFAELQDFIDQPVKHYSSGMYVRLGFSVAIEVDPDILLIDEVLAVGDAGFQRKCLERIREFKRQGKTLLIISHDLHTIQSISDRILFLDAGEVKGIDTPGKVVGQYLLKTGESRRAWGTGEAVISDVHLENSSGVACDMFGMGETLFVRARCRSTRRIEDPVFGVAIHDDQGRQVLGNNSQIEGCAMPALEGESAFALRIGPLHMAAGRYNLSFSVHSADHRTQYHRLDHWTPFIMTTTKQFEGSYMPCTWTLTP
jgi:ABC-type polysaccharide/polyol phosphate transport system ATPase subunit